MSKIEPGRYNRENGALAIANAFIERSLKENKSINLLNIVALTYFAKGWSLAGFNNSLFEERVEVWKYGPIIPSVYITFSGYGTGRIKKCAKLFNPDTGKQDTPFIYKDDKNVLDVIYLVWKRYSSLSAKQLVNLIQSKGTPWHDSRERGDMFIDDIQMKKFFGKKHKEYTK